MREPLREGATVGGVKNPPTRNRPNTTPPPQGPVPDVEQYREQLRKIQAKVEHAQERIARLGSRSDLATIDDLLDQIEWLVDEALGWYFGSTT